MFKVRKPIGITFLAIVFFLFGIYGFLNFCFGLSIVRSALHCRSIPFIAHILGLLPSLAYISFIILSPGLFMLKSWARKCSIIISCLMILYILSNDISTIFLLRRALFLKYDALYVLKRTIISSLIIIIKLVIFSFSIYYLTKTQTREIFNHKKS